MKIFVRPEMILCRFCRYHWKHFHQWKCVIFAIYSDLSVSVSRHSLTQNQNVVEISYFTEGSWALVYIFRPSVCVNWRAIDRSKFSCLINPCHEKPGEQYPGQIALEGICETFFRLYLCERW